MDSFVTRRGFLGTGAAGALALAGMSSSTAACAAAADEAKDPFGGFLVGVQSYSFRHFNLEQALMKTRELGLHFVEFFRGHVPVNSTDDQIRSVRALCFQYDITPVAFGVESFTKDNAANRRIFEFARKLGVRYLERRPQSRQLRQPRQAGQRVRHRHRHSSAWPARPATAPLVFGGSHQPGRQPASSSDRHLHRHRPPDSERAKSLQSPPRLVAADSPDGCAQLWLAP